MYVTYKSNVRAYWVTKIEQILHRVESQMLIFGLLTNITQLDATYPNLDFLHSFAACILNCKETKILYF